MLNYLEIISRIKKSLFKKDMESLYYNLCQIEQFLADYRILDEEILSLTYLENIRKLILKIANFYFYKKTMTFEIFMKIFQLYNLLSTLNLQINNNQEHQKGVFIPELKIAESLSHFGVYPQDFFINMSLKSIKPIVFVIGIRSAGSYFAPAVCTALNLNSYFTIRLGVKVKANTREIIGSYNDCPFLIALDELNELKSKVLQSNIVIIVDEGPGTGSTFKYTAKAISQFNPNCQIIILHTRELNHSLEENCQTIYIPPTTFYHVYIMEILEQLKEKLNSQSFSVEIEQDNVKHGAFKNKLSLQKHESPKILITFFIKQEQDNQDNIERKFVAKFIGFNFLGRERYKKLKKISKFSPNIILFYQGILVYEYVNKNQEISLENYHLKLVAEYFFSFYQLSFSQKILYSEYLEEIDKVIQNNSSLLDYQTKQKYLYLFNSLKTSLDKNLCIITEPDWKLEKDKWLFAKDKVIKFDNFHFKDYDDSPMADIFIQIAGFSIEFNLTKNQECILMAEILKLLELKYNRQIISQIIILNKILYLIRKINYYDYIAKKLKNYCWDIQAIKNHIQFLIAKQQEII